MSSVRLNVSGAHLLMHALNEHIAYQSGSTDLRG